MKKIVLFFYVCCSISCNSQTTKQQNLAKDTSQEISTQLVIASPVQVPQKDTLIKISADRAILFLRYNADMELWYEPYIVNLNRKDTMKIVNYVYENGSEPYLSISPNKKYLVIDNIIKGYVETDEGKELHENYFCAIIDMENAVMVWRSQKDCDGEWNDENNWIKGNEIIYP